MSRVTRRYAGLMLVAALMLVVAACGGASPTATSAPTAAPTATRQPTTAQPSGTPTPRPTATPEPTRPLAPTATSAGPEPRRGGTLQARAYREWSTWDTYDASGGYSTHVMSQMLSNLIRFKKTSYVIEGDLAEKWEAGSDGKTYTFSLRRGVQWHDGKPFTADDVVYDLRRASDPKTTFNKEKVAGIATIEAPDPYTVRVTTKNISVSFLPGIATMFMLMYPAHIPDLQQWQKSPVGTGAFSLKEYKAGVAWDFLRNAAYYDKDAAGRQLPYLDELVFNVIVDRGLALSAFRTGKLQCACSFDSDIFQVITDDQARRDIPGVQLGSLLSSRISLEINTAKAPLNNRAFRQAVAIGLDKDEVADSALPGRSFHPAPPMIPPEVGGQWGLPREELTKIPGYNRDHSADLKIARQKLQDSGIDPKSVTLELDSQVFYNAVSEGIASKLATDLGIKTNIVVPATTGEATQRKRDGLFQMNLNTFPMVIDDPVDNYANLIVTGGGQAFTRFSNPRVDQLLAAQDSEVDAAKRKQMLWEVQRIQLDELPFVPILWVRAVIGARPEVGGVVFGPTTTHSYLRMEHLWLRQ